MFASLAMLARSQLLLLARWRMINKPMWLPILFNSKMGSGYYGCKKTESEGIARGLGLFVAITSEATFITSKFPTYQCHNNFSSTKTLTCLAKSVVTQTKTSYTIFIPSLLATFCQNIQFYRMKLMLISQIFGVNYPTISLSTTIMHTV